MEINAQGLSEIHGCNLHITSIAFLSLVYTVTAVNRLIEYELKYSTSN